MDNRSGGHGGHGSHDSPSAVYFAPDKLSLRDASPAHARRALLAAAQEMSSRGLDNGANWALDLASCLQGGSNDDDDDEEYDGVDEGLPTSSFTAFSPPSEHRGPFDWQTSTPARGHHDGNSTTAEGDASVASTSGAQHIYPMQSTPFLGIQAPSSSSFRQDLSSPQPARVAAAAAANHNNNNGNSLNLNFGPRASPKDTIVPSSNSPAAAAAAGTATTPTLADNSLSGRFPPPFRQPPSPLSNLSYSADEGGDSPRRRGIGGIGIGSARGPAGGLHPGAAAARADRSTSHPLSISHSHNDGDDSQDDTLSTQGGNDDESMAEDGATDTGGEDSRSAHVRFASEGKDSSLGADSEHRFNSAAASTSRAPHHGGANATHESTVYSYALSCFRLGQMERCKWQLDKLRARAGGGGSSSRRKESDRVVFLRGYVGMLILERRAASDTVFALSASRSTPSHARALIPLLKDGLIDPSDPFCLLLKGILLRKLHKRIEAMDCFMRSIALMPYNWTTWLELNAVIESSAGELDEILPLLPQSFMTLLFLEHHHRQSAATKDPQANTDRLQVLLELFPENAGLWNSLAMQRYLQRDFESAIELFQKAREIDPYLIEGLADYSNALFLTDRGEELAHLAHTTAEWGSETSEVCCVIGNHLYYQTDQTRAIEAFKRAIKLDPNSLGAWILLGHGYVEVKNTSAAMEMYRRAIEINPRDFRPWHGLGKVYELMGAWSFACKYYLKAAGLAPYTSQVWQSLALTYTRLGMVRDAISAYQRHLSCEPTNVSAQLSCISNILDILAIHGPPDEVTAWHCRASQIVMHVMGLSDVPSAADDGDEQDRPPANFAEANISIDMHPWIITALVSAAKAEAGLAAEFQPAGQSDGSSSGGGAHDAAALAALRRSLAPTDVSLASDYLRKVLAWSGGLAAAEQQSSAYDPSGKHRNLSEAAELLQWFQTGRA